MSQKPIRAAQYIRMSTDAQDLSPEMQTNAISAYADREGFSVVETYLDAGRSGLTLQNRPAMKRLLEDAVRPGRPFDAILVYDVSRWGRFQDTDASAYYEYHCRMHGVDVRYVQEPFTQFDSPLVALLKGMKRVMAAEYSRELGVKTRAGQGIAMAHGFHMGSLPPLGIGRVAVAKQSGMQRPLAANEHKSSRGEHLKWVRGPDQEVGLVQRIFRLYTDGDMSVPEIARLLHREGRLASSGRPFTQNMLYRMLRCEAYVGDFVWGRCDALKHRRDENHERFQRVKGSVESILQRDVWEAARVKRTQRVGAARGKGTLLADLLEALQSNPKLTASDLVSLGCACRATYVNAFGSFAAAVALLDRAPYKRTREDYRGANDKRALGSRLCSDVAAVLERAGLRCTRPKSPNGSHSLELDGRVKVRVQLIWRRRRHGIPTWFLPKIYRELFDHALLIRVEDDGSVFDSILLAADRYLRHRRWFVDDLEQPVVWLTTEAQIAARFRCLA
ncbi:recombinase family protein [Ramlibacter sp. AN1133]|uniref:recombinase family protein n=1 Tax=Ramlibacter sp. AN1133 TaxID=3133429 RepID=UPI0030BF74DD